MNGTAGFVLIPSRVQPSAFVVDGKPLNVNANPCMTSWSFPDCSGLSLALDLRRKEMSVTLETVEGGQFFHATTWSTCFMWLGTYRKRCMRILIVMRGYNMRNKKNHGYFFLGRRYETPRLEILTPLWRISKSFLREEQRVCSVNAKLAGRTFSCRAPDWRKERDFFNTFFCTWGRKEVMRQCRL